MTPISANAELARRDGEVRLALPWPPSVNMLYANVRGKGRVATKEYDVWKREAGWTLQAQRPPKYRVPVSIVVELCPPHNRRFDLDNKNKCILDLLVRHDVIADDHSGLVRSVTVQRVENAAPCTVIVRPA